MRAPLPPLRSGLLALILALLYPGALTAQVESGLEEGYFELYVQRIPDRIPLITLVDSVGRVLIPLTPVLEHLGIPMSRGPDGLVLEWPPETWRTVVNGENRTIIREDEVIPVLPEQWARQGGEEYLGEEVLGRILSARVEVVWADLVVLISENLEFPSTKRLEAEARRARERLQGSLFDPDRFTGLGYEPRTGGWAAGWGLSLAEAGGTTRGSLRGTLGASLLGGGVEAGGTTLLLEGSEADFSDAFARYTRVFTGSDLIRRVQVGSVLSEGTLARRVLGFSITNQPLTTPRFFTEAVVTPAVPAGWEYEIYQGDHLVGVSSAESPSEIRAPLNYGNTPVRIRLIGPAGQEMEEELVFVVPQGRVPPGSWRYSLGGGSCQDRGCRDYWYGEVLRGVTPWLTAGLGADRLTTKDSDSFLPFGQLDISPRPNMGVGIQARGSSHFRTNVSYAGGRRGTLSGSYAWTGREAAVISVKGWSGQAAASGPLPFLGGRWVSGRILLRGQKQGELDHWQASLATAVRRTHLALDVESGLQRRGMATLRAFHTLGPPLPEYVQDLSLTGALGVTERGLELGELGGSVRTRHGALINIQLRLRRGVPGILTIGTTLRSALGYFQARTSRGGGTGSYLGADGGLAYSREAGLLTLPYQSVGRAGVRGSVFQDLDGNGERSPEEPPMPGATVLVEGRRVTTDEEGRYRVWEITPYEGMAVALDSLSLDPQWAPAVGEVLLRPSPNLFNRVDLPVHLTREVMGSVVRRVGGGIRPQGGVRVRILDSAGVVVAEERTFSDGVFYFQRVRPGRYALRVVGVDQEGLSGLSFTVPTGQGEAIELEPLELGGPGD